MGRKAKDLEVKEDRISDLPDGIIQHILSLLPSTKQAVQTGILSKRWRNQWTHVPVLIFELSTWNDEIAYDCFLKFIEDTLNLHNCSKIKKFHIYYPISTLLGFSDAWLDEKICFAARKNVEDLHLCFISPVYNYMWPLPGTYTLPKDIFNNASFVKLRAIHCEITPHGMVNWGRLETLTLVDCKFSYQAVEHILSGSPVLKSFELTNSCIEYKKLVIASKSLKRLVLGDLNYASDIEISCPNLEKLKLCYSWSFETSELLNLPTSLCATIDFVELKILQQLEDVKELKIGRCFIEDLSDLEPMEGLLFPVLNIKSLTLNYPDLNKHHFGVACLLHNSPLIEKLVIKVPNYDMFSDFTDINDFEDNYWNSDEMVFECLVSHLKTIHIIGIPKGDDMRKLVLNFVRFLLKNAKVLEKMVIVLKEYHGTTFPSNISQELLSLPRCSQSAIVELLCLE